MGSTPENYPLSRSRPEKRQEIQETEVVGVANLPFWDEYCHPQILPRSRNRGFRPKPINGVVVRKWENKECGPGQHVVFLTNQPVDKPLTVFDDYDGRSLIENLLFREGKQGWELEHTPQKTQRATVAHICITFAMFALTTAYREWYRQEKEAESKETFLHEEEEVFGIKRWRRERLKKNRDYVIVFEGSSYGVFHIAEMSTLAGIRLRELPKELGTRTDIFARYGLSPPS